MPSESYLPWKVFGDLRGCESSVCAWQIWASFVARRRPTLPGSRAPAISGLQQRRAAPRILAVRRRRDRYDNYGNHNNVMSRTADDRHRYRCYLLLRRELHTETGSHGNGYRRAEETRDDNINIIINDVAGLLQRCVIAVSIRTNHHQTRRRKRGAVRSRAVRFERCARTVSRRPRREDVWKTKRRRQIVRREPVETARPPPSVPPSYPPAHS